MTKHHPEDDMLAALIAEGATFNAFMRVGPFEKYRGDIRQSYRDARADCDDLVAQHGKFGRKAIVYAVTHKGITIPVDDRLATLAGVS